VTPAEIKALVRSVPHFPAPGILFRDITSLLAHPEGFAATIDHLVEAARPARASAVAGIEARGFIFGAAIAARLGLGFVPLRKAGKLPVATIGVDYALEYGQARLELDPTLVAGGEPVLLVDDLIATGGTAEGAVKLLRQIGANVLAACFIIDLPDLGGADKLRAMDVPVRTLMAFEGH